MKRTKPLRRKTRLRSRSTTNSYRRRTRDIDYMRAVRRLPCVVNMWRAKLIWLRALGGDAPDAEALEAFASVLFGLRTPTLCYGRVQADHAGERGLGMKSADDTCIGLCRHHHTERTDYAGTFYGFSGVQMRAWCDWAIAHTRLEVAKIRQVVQPCQ